MAARRRLNVGGGQAAGIAGTRQAYAPCQRPGCGHPRVRHAADGACAALNWTQRAVTDDVVEATGQLCGCPGYTEGE